MAKTVIITGAGRGIGLATAKLLLEKGYNVYGISLHAHADLGFPVYECDVTDTHRAREILKEINEKSGGLYAFINNAGFGISGPAEFCSEENIQRLYDVDLTSAVKLCACAVPYLRQNGGGKIINVCSVASVIPIPFQACYSSAKAGLENFSYALANEVKPFKIKVSCILAGDTATGFTDSRIKTDESVTAVYRGRAEKSVAKMERDERRGKPPYTVAKAVYGVLKKNSPPLRKTVGFGYKFIVFLTRILPIKLVNYIVAKLYA